MTTGIANAAKTLKDLSTLSNREESVRFISVISRLLSGMTCDASDFKKMVPHGQSLNFTIVI